MEISKEEKKRHIYSVKEESIGKIIFYNNIFINNIIAFLIIFENKSLNLCSL